MILDTKTDVKSHQSELVVKAMEIMQKTYSDPDLNMASLADQLGISPVTLAVEFKNETGISPSDYLAVVRLERAKELLRTTDQLSLIHILSMIHKIEKMCKINVRYVAVA